MLLALALTICVSILFLIGPKPRLDGATIKASTTPVDTSLSELSEWLAQQEEEAAPSPGTEARIVFAEPDQPSRTPWVFLYLHGFSATWPETAPLTQELADQYSANVLQSRIAGHGCGTEGMRVSA